MLYYPITVTFMGSHGHPKFEQIFWVEFLVKITWDVNGSPLNWQYLWDPNENILKKKSILIKVQILGGLLTDYNDTFEGQGQNIMSKVKVTKVIKVKNVKIPVFSLVLEKMVQGRGQKGQGQGHKGQRSRSYVKVKGRRSRSQG